MQALGVFGLQVKSFARVFVPTICLRNSGRQNVARVQTAVTGTHTVGTPNLSCVNLRKSETLCDFVLIVSINSKGKCVAL